MDINELMEVFLESTKQIQPDDLAYLFATGKSELEIRNQLALHLHASRHPQQVIAREWKRHDLTILEAGIPKLIIEGKSWTHFDATSNTKLNFGDKSILSGMLRDIKKLKATQDHYPEMQGFISVLLFTVDVTQLNKKALDHAQVTYAYGHGSGARKFGSALESAIQGINNLTELLAQYGEVKTAPLAVGNFLEMPVKVDLFLMRPY